MCCASSNEIRQGSAVVPKLQHLDRGEREAISLAASLSVGSVLIDERKGRLAARERGLAVSGTLGVLDLAARRGLVTLSEALWRLEGTTFRVSPRLIGLIKARESE